MPVTVPCPNPKCGRPYPVDENGLGGQAVCPKCGQTFNLEIKTDETPRPAGDAPGKPPPAVAAKHVEPRRTAMEPTADASERREFKKIGPYAVRRRLGGGAMGQVWLAYDAALQREVAVKTLRPEYARNETYLKRFLREARAAAHLQHPNTITIYQVAAEGSLVYMAMELVDGGSLDSAVDDGKPLDWREATRAIRDAAAGLAAAHEIGLVHRDVKPANLMRTSKGLVKVADFGLARTSQQDSRLTQQGALMGTPAFMAPELWQRKEADARSDLYALACTYYTLLTGGVPFEADNFMALGYQHTHEPLPDPRPRAPGLPDAVCRILAKGTHKEPSCRYQSAGEMLAELEAALASPQESLTFDIDWDSLVPPQTQFVEGAGAVSPGGAASAAGTVVQAADPKATLGGPKASKFAGLLRLGVIAVAVLLLAGVAIYLATRGPTTNTLSDAERADGWKLLFDGKSTAGWHAADASPISAICEVDGSELMLKGGRAYILSDERFGDFELQLEWRVSPGGNSGVLFRCPGGVEELALSCPEVQLIDNESENAAKAPCHTAGSLQNLHEAPRDAAKPTGQWNTLRLLVDGSHAEHWLNGTKVVEYELGSPDFLTRVAVKSTKKKPFKPDFARQTSGAIALQAWDPSTWYRNVKIRPLVKESKAAGKAAARTTAPERVAPPSSGVSAASAWRDGEKTNTNSVGMKFALIPAGEFMMGSPDTDPKATADEKPRHRVRITRPFYLGTLEVTQGQYAQVMGRKTDGDAGEANCSVQLVSWQSAIEFCRRLGEKEGTAYRLPTEAEWEYACRAGSTTRWHFGDSEYDANRYAWCRWASSSPAQKAFQGGMKIAHLWGLCDMHGNVAEWCDDWYQADYYARSPQDDPRGPVSGNNRVLRGGSYLTEPALARSSCRSGAPAAANLATAGFRVARTWNVSPAATSTPASGKGEKRAAGR